MLQTSPNTLISVFVVVANILFLSSLPVTEAQNSTDKKALRCPSNCEPNGKCILSDDGSPMHCECMVGFSGYDCSFPYEQCPDGFTTCYNGAKCTRGLSDKDGTDKDGRDDQPYVCDCEQMDNNPSQFVIEQCENPVDDVCEIGVKLSQYAFCTNSGKCLELVQSGEAHPGCDCPKEFEGRHCQYKEGTAPEAELMLVWNANPEEEEDDPIDEMVTEPTKILVWIVVASLSVLLALAAFAFCVYARLKHVSEKRHEKSITRIGVISLRDMSTDSKDEEKFDDIVLGGYSDDESDKHII
mmetsp:Transcript_20521/g.50345  ORF Transcript_20521/g.50345 Transcript_20521/m.50345 type:complete len:298 (+) Transcript_20521:228-1121(+)